MGDEVEIAGELRDTDDNSLVDPTNVFGWTRDPAGVVTTYEYSVDSEVTRTSLGRYSLTFSPDAPGMWYAGLYSTGSGKASSPDSAISVRSTRRTAPATTVVCV